MTLPASFSTALLAGAIALAVALPAHARNESHMRPIAGALAKKRSREIVGDLPLLFGSASAKGSELMPDMVEATGEASIIVDPRSRQHLTDEEACQHAFEDAIGKLVDRARRAGAAAVVGIVSNFKGDRVDDPKSYNCHSGSSKSYVTLQGGLAKHVPSPAQPGGAASAAAEEHQ